MKIKKQNYKHVINPWKPLYNKDSRVILLGSLPSPKSISFGFFYGSPRNIFWKTLSKALGQKEPKKNIASRKRFVLKNHMAIWLTIKEADIIGSKDSTIKNPIFNDFSKIVLNSKIKYFFAEGKKSYLYFNNNISNKVGSKAIYLPSTSPANCAMQKKPIFMERWSLLKKALDGKI